MRRQNSQFGQRFPRAGWLGNANRALYLLLHHATNWGKPERERNAARRNDAGRGFSQGHNNFQFFEIEQIHTEQKWIDLCV
jgi:hypothetical protein